MSRALHQDRYRRMREREATEQHFHTLRLGLMPYARIDPELPPIFLTILMDHEPFVLDMLALVEDIVRQGQMPRTYAQAYHIWKELMFVMERDITGSSTVRSSAFTEDDQAQLLPVLRAMSNRYQAQVAWGNEWPLRHFGARKRSAGKKRSTHRKRRSLRHAH